MDSKVENCITPPSWMGASFIEEKLRESWKNNELEVMKCDISPATAVGENYVSQMFRMKLVLRRGEKKKPEELSLVIKSLPIGQTVLETVRGANLFGTESLMLADTLPELNALLYKIPAHERLSCLCHYYQGPPDDVLVMEDLRVSGYTLADRHGGLDANHVNLVLENMAKLHAASLVLIDRDPSLKTTYEDFIWSEKFDAKLSKLIRNAFENLSDELRTWDDVPGKDKHWRKLEELRRDMPGKVYEICVRDDRKLNTVIHGDCWVNNMMFRYEDDVPVGLKFVDFQLASINTPALDLNYFLFTSVKDLSDITSLLRVYHDAFTNTLQALQFDRPYSFQELQNDFYDKLLFGLAASVLILPVVVSPAGKAPDIDAAMDQNSDYRNKEIFQNASYKDAVIRLLPIFEKHGLL